MQKISRLYDNKVQIGRYESNHVPKEPEKVPEDKRDNIHAASALPLAIFSNSTFTKTNAQYVPIYRSLLHNTTQIVYAKQEFFQNALQEQPNFIESLWNEISLELGKKEENQKPIQNVTELANIKLQDPELQKVWVEMLPKKFEPGSIGASCKGEGQPKELPTILDFLQTDNSYLNLRIQLLPRELLLALFQDETTVEHIIHERYELYKQVKNANKDDRPTVKAQATKQFTDHFKGALPPDFPPDKANFQITGTRPPK